VDAYVADRPEIEVSFTGVGIPQEFREGFYQTLLKARRAITEDVVGDTLFAERSVFALKEVRSQLIHSLNLEEYVLPSALQAFTEDLYGGASQFFLDKMLSYVQGRFDAAGLYAQALARLPQAFNQLAMAAYEAQMAYSAVLMLEPAAVFAAEPLDDARAKLVPTRSLELGYQAHSATLRLPEAVFETAWGKIGFKFELASEIDYYDSRPTRRRDFSSGGDTHGVIGRRFALFYRLGAGDTVPYLADRDKLLMLKPDIVFGTLRRADLEIESYCRVTLKRIETLAAQRATVFDVLDGIDEVKAFRARPGIPSFEIIATNFDNAKLRPLITALIKAA
jgi:hypothetical protein